MVNFLPHLTESPTVSRQVVTNSRDKIHEGHFCNIGATNGD